ncbi:rod shape-determining protein MreD [Ureibacillus chungkukjangi]|uniref:Rod shape-determining protein MreD n=1 Tax=Ureibacillus chungkukjangi TaxID=1202712 RepID=A0A318U9Y8_9BACL|nr:rod shape-determining protein MreD [Ureibacillus chungkukjangi]MCM3388079.1 rod shape-determining protein MreD [Ureibacillus chungkukjangi]PYF08869.1 rod shape-determining protein MreD [Ureibacillus chungkukjangi]
MIRFLIPFVAVVLFLLEPEFALFSPISWGDQTLILVPRFVILYLIFISIYYSKKRACLYGLIFGLLYDVFYIDIIGLYSFLYPLVCFVAGSTVKFIHQHLSVTTILSVVLVALMEAFLYYFFSFIQFTTIPVSDFLSNRLLPTIIANLLFLIMLGWAFKYLINARLLQRARDNS